MRSRCSPTGMVAARPALPLNTLLGIGEEAVEKPLEPLVPLPVVANAKPRVAAAERNSHVPVAINGADVRNHLAEVLIQRFRVARKLHAGEKVRPDA